MNCSECKFYSWNEEYKKYVCDIKGCYEYSKFVRFQGEYDKENGWY